MRGGLLTCAVVALMSASALAQEPPKLDELQKMYDDALAQLKAAQDRKNELGVENEQLRAQLAEANARADALAVQANDFADRTFHLRSMNAAWHEFLQQYPSLRARWQVFLETELLSAPRELPEYIDPNWPLSAGG